MARRTPHSGERQPDGGVSLARISNNLRCGLFVGARYALGFLPILEPGLKTYLVLYDTKSG
jgi:hypothetical protein